VQVSRFGNIKIKVAKPHHKYDTYKNEIFSLRMSSTLNDGNTLGNTRK